MTRTGRLAVVVSIMACTACVTTGSAVRFDCPPDALAGWEIPPGWIGRELSLEAAARRVAAGNLGPDQAGPAWRRLEDAWRPGDRLAAYSSPPTGGVRPVGPEEGIVLLRGCRQVGSVATSVR